MAGDLTNARALVVGGGVIGLTSALRLAEAGASVTLLERGAVGAESSWAGGGILSPLPPWRAPPAVWALARESLAAYPVLCAELATTTGIDPEWRRSGMLVLRQDGGETIDPSEPRDAAKRWCASEGLAVDAVPAHVVEPELQHLGPALRLPWVAQLRNPRLCRALRARLRQLGVDVREHVGMTRFATVPGSPEAAAVVAGDAVLTADTVVLAAGAWSGEWLAGSGWAPAVAPVAGEMLLLRGPPGLLRHVVLDEGSGRYLIPRSDGHLLVGSTLAARGFDKSPTSAAREQLLAFAHAVMPATRVVPVVAHWAGLRPGSPDSVPTIQRHPGYRNLFVNTGHFRYGLTMAPASAERLLACVSEALADS